jgi:hypothetical protein
MFLTRDCLNLDDHFYEMKWFELNEFVSNCSSQSTATFRENWRGHIQFPGSYSLRYHWNII